MDFADSVDELQQIADYRHARKTLRGAGIGALIFGLIAIAVGAVALREHPINIILLLIGIMLLGEGMFNIILPTAEGIIVDGIALLIVGLWNVFVSVINLAGGGDPQAAKWGILGLIQIGWCVARIMSYPKFHKNLLERPSEQDLKRMDRLVKGMSKSKAKDTDDMVEFQHKGFLKQQVWKGQLSGDAAAFVDTTGLDVLVAYKEDVRFKNEGKVMLGKTLKATFKIRDRKLHGTISPEYYRRYKEWKNAQRDEPAEE